MTYRQPEKPQKYGRQPRLYLRLEVKILRLDEQTAKAEGKEIERVAPDAESGAGTNRIVPSVRLDLYVIYEDEYGEKSHLGIQEQREIRLDDEEVDLRILELVEEGEHLYDPSLYDEVEDLLVSTYWYRRFIGERDPRITEEIISEWNEVEYVVLSKKIDEFQAKQSTLKESDQDAAEGIGEKINRLKAFKRKFVNWFEDREFTLPETTGEVPIGGHEKEAETKVIQENEFKHSDGYETIWYRGKKYYPTRGQRPVMRILNKARLHGTPDIDKSYLLEAFGTKSDVMRDCFKSRPDIWKDLIKSGQSRGTYRLNI